MFLRITRRIATAAVLTTAVVLGLVMLVPAIAGYQRYVILTGSMTGTYDRGSIVFDKAVPTRTLEVGDPITYEPPPGASPNQKHVTHRIARVLPGPAGNRAFVTKGDANPREDAWKFTLSQPTQDKVMFHIPYAGYVFMFLQVREFRTALIGIPALLMAGWLLLGMWRDGGHHVRRHREGVQPWGADVAKRLPALAPLAERAAVAARASVRLAVSWPASKAAAARGRIRAGFVTRLVKPRRRTSGTSGVVALPPTCVAGPRRVGSRQRDRLPADWRLVVNARI